MSTAQRTIANFAAPPRRTTPGAPAASGGGRSYRRTPRVLAAGQVAIYPRRRGSKRIGRQVARIRDYSSTGLGLLSHDMIEPGTRFAVRLVRPDGTKVAVAFEVVYCRPLDGQNFQVGAKVPEGPSEDAELYRKPPRTYETSIDGKTVSGWERVLDIRAEEDRLWINMHPPDRASGWGMFVDRESFERILRAGPT